MEMLTEDERLASAQREQQNRLPASKSSQKLTDSSSKCLCEWSNALPVNANATSAQRNQQESPLLRLSAECRNLIYEHVFRCRWGPRGCFRRTPPTEVDEDVIIYQRVPSFEEGVVDERPLEILRTCRQIYNEAHALPAQFTTVVSNLTRGMSEYAFYTWIDSPERASAEITSLSISIWVDIDVYSVQHDWIEDLVDLPGDDMVPMVWDLKRTGELPSLAKVHVWVRPEFIARDLDYWSGDEHWDKLMEEKKERVIEAVRECVLPKELRTGKKKTGLEFDVEFAMD